jgi:hypothetical protein
VGDRYSYQDKPHIYFPNRKIKSALGDLRIYDIHLTQTHKKILINALNMSDFAVLIISVEDRQDDK